MEREGRNRLLVGLLLGILLLSTALNFYLLLREEPPVNYDFEAGLPVSVTEMELVRTREQLAECQRQRSAPDTLTEVARRTQTGRF